MPNPNPYLALAAAAEQRANAATPGPWIHLPECANEYKIASQARPPMSFGFYEPRDCRADLNFIAHARQDVPALAASVREQAATIAALQAKLTEALALAEAGYREGRIHQYEESNPDVGFHTSKNWEGSQTRAAVERLKLEAV